MTKRTRKLNLKKETLKSLEGSTLGQVQGGAPGIVIGTLCTCACAALQVKSAGNVSLTSAYV